MMKYMPMNINDGIRVKSEEEVPVEMVNTIVTGVSETIENSLEEAASESASEVASVDVTQETKTDTITVSDYLGDDEEADNENAIDIDDIDWNTIFDS